MKRRIYSNEKLDSLYEAVPRILKRSIAGLKEQSKHFCLENYIVRGVPEKIEFDLKRAFYYLMPTVRIRKLQTQKKTGKSLLELNASLYQVNEIGRYS